MFYGDKFKELNLGSVSKGWEVSQLQHIGTITRGRHWGIAGRQLKTSPFIKPDTTSAICASSGYSLIT